MQCLILRERCARIFPLFIFGFLELGKGASHVCWEICAGAPGGLPGLVRSPAKVRKKEENQRLFSSCGKNTHQSKSDLEPGLLLHFI